MQAFGACDGWFHWQLCVNMWRFLQKNMLDIMHMDAFDKLCVFVRGLLICANFKLEETYIVGNHFESGKFFKCEAKWENNVKEK